MTGNDLDLFSDGSARGFRGTMRRGLDEEIKRARADGLQLPASLVAGVRHICDRADSLNAILRRQGDNARAYDHVAFTQVMREFRETHATLFPEASHDPLDDLIASFAAEERHEPGHRPTD